jgi:hypothetical protein
MTDWTTLRHAYGDASDVPGLLHQLVPDPEAEVWNALWSRLCHQGTVYSASFAALPHLLQSAQEWTPDQRTMVISLAGAIAVSRDVAGQRQAPDAQLEPTLLQLERLALETLSAPGLPPSDFIYVAQSVLAFQGDTLWGDQLDGLVSGEFDGLCPSCDSDLYLVVGQYGFFVTPEEWVNRPSAKRLPINRAAVPALSGVGRWLYEQAVTAGQTTVAEWLLYLFGTTACPNCSHQVSVVACVERASSPTRA